MENLPPYEQWQPYTLAEVAQYCVGVDWILAGGHALHLFLGKAYRQNTDIDVLVVRNEQQQLTQTIAKQKLFVATIPGKLTPYDTQKYYEQPIQDIWCLNADNNAWGLQIMLFDLVADHWVYKRNPAIQLPLHQIYFEKEEIKVLKPEIQLLYKSKATRPKDQVDFETIVPHLEAKARQWLLQALTKCYPVQHPWLLDLQTL
ncbi:MAG TPA: hypothetical protein DCS93_43715 [Microscillaceae bacterium]|nr:hypothetical protein [Microscillaceae bacterium]